MARSYIRHQIAAKRRHGVHSPFVYELGENVLYAKSATQEKEIEDLRKKLLKDQKKIELQDYGAGSRVNQSSERRISEIAKNSATPKKVAQLLQRLVQYFESENILEMGTNLGLTTAYLSSANEKTKVWSLEGDPTLAELAVKNLKNLNLNAKILVGEFEESLDSTLNQMKEVDFAYLDGNHRRVPTLAYFKSILPHCHAETVLALGDIHWSDEMEEAWEEIKSNEKITLTIDLFHVGLVFFRKGRSEVEHFRLKL
jgi:predicted O-methyltransferase YrrM